MKRQEFLTIFLLAVLVTGGSWLVEWRSVTCGIVKCIGVYTFCHGFPLTFATTYKLSPRYSLSEVGSCADLLGRVSWSFSCFILCFLSWFLALASVWFIVKKLRKRGE
jgi:hypothetical protein